MCCYYSRWRSFILRGSGTGWLNAEYSLLPSATLTRSPREASRGRQNGRTQEIQRLIGRCLRSVMDFKALGERTVIIDCDVIQADGGTRTASITGAFVALAEALATIYDPKKPFPLKDFMAAISVGISKDNEPILDLCYEEDSTAIADMNIVMTGEGHFVEIQGTGEKQPFTHEQFSKMLAYAQKGIDELISYQKDILGNDLVWKIGRIHDEKNYCSYKNQGKIKEMINAFKNLPVELHSLSEFGPLPDAVEDGTTFEENAIKKAKFYAQKNRLCLFSR